MAGHADAKAGSGLGGMETRREGGGVNCLWGEWRQEEREEA